MNDILMNVKIEAVLDNVFNYCNYTKIGLSYDSRKYNVALMTS